MEMTYSGCRALSHDVTAAILVFQNSETAAMLMFQTNPVGVELKLFLCKCFLLFQQICQPRSQGSLSCLCPLTLVIFKLKLIYRK